MSGEATGYVWRESPYTGATFIVHLAIADVVNDLHGNEFWMSLKMLAAKARVGRATAIRALAQLVTDGYLIKLTDGHAQGQAVRYSFEMDASKRDTTMRPGRSHHEGGEVSPRDLPLLLTKENSKERKTKRDVTVAAAECPAIAQDLIRAFCTLLDGNGVHYSITAKWYDAMRLMITNDERSPEEIRGVMTWAAADEFWRANVLSVPTLREKFDKLRLSMKRPETKRRAGQVTEDAILAALDRNEAGR